MECFMAGIEIERKYIIKLPSLDAVREIYGYTHSEITQIYLESGEGVTHRVRKRVYGDRTSYTETVKTRIDKMSVVEDEREITEAEYSRLSERVKKGTRPVKKTRYTVPSGKHLIEIDVYPEWKHTCIMETELSDRGESVVIPDFISIVEEVTGRFEYSNASMARNFPKEIEVK